jgi:uncharacterized membrane protein
MAEPGDPNHTEEHIDEDDLVGFASAASLEGRPRDAEPDPEPEEEPEPEPEPDLFDDEKIAAGAAAGRGRPIRSDSIFEPSPEFSGRSRRRDEPPAPVPGGGMTLYAVYALILFAVPTLGVSALIGLLAVTGRDGPEDDLSRSHFIYQQRTLWAAAVAAVAGLILLAAPLALGVPLLFVLALWTVLRGASGVWTLKSGRAIPDPLGWWI